MAGSLIKQIVRGGLGAGLVVIGLWGAPAMHAQTQPADAKNTLPKDGLNPDSFYGKDSAQGVYVRDSAIALEKLAHAARMERLKDWDTAAQLLQEILDQYRDRMVPSQVDKDNNIYQYTSVVKAVQEKLAKWPEEGLNAYRNRYEGAAAAILGQAKRDDFAALKQVENRYFATESGKTAAIRLMDLYLEAGEFDAAAWEGDRLLDWHPNLLVERPKVLYRTALAYHMSGNAPSAQRRLEELKDKFADAVGTVRGEDVNLAASLAEAMAQRKQVVHASSGGSYRMLGGAPDRALVPAVSCSPGALFYSVPLAKPTPTARGATAARTADDLEKSAERNGLNLGVIPAADRGELFFQDGSRLYAVSLESGLPLSGWLATYPGERKGQYALSNQVLPRRGQYSVALADNAVLAIMGQPVRSRMELEINGMGQGVIQGETKLVCLDRENGKEKWGITPGKLPADPAALRSLNLVGAPLSVGEHVYALARGGKGGQFEDCYALCFDLNTGAFKWASYVASASLGVPFWDGSSAPSFADNIGHLAYANGSLYVLSNLGAVASLDAYSGTIQWLSIYPRDGVMDPRQAANWAMSRQPGGQQPKKPWIYSPPIIKDGHVYALPTDGQCLMVYDAGSGVELKRIALKDVGNGNTLLGVWKQWVVVAGNNSVFAIDWQRYRTAPAVGDSAVVSKRFTGRSGSSDPVIRGRGFVTADSLYIATVEGLSRLALSDSLASNGLMTTEKYPPGDRSWDDSEAPGNLLVTGQQVVITSGSRVDVYTDLAVARKKLDGEVAAAPNDPEPRVRYAELLFVAGQRDAALEKLDEAIGLLGGRSMAGPGRTRVFNAALLFGQKMAREEHPNAALAEQLFNRAATAAVTPPQQVNYRFSRAQFAKAQGDAATQAKLYQEILADPEMRLVAIARDEYSTPEQAQVIAETAIKQLLETEAGRIAYAPFQQVAQAALESARTSKDPAKFLAVAQTYPNAQAAAPAMLEAADAYESAENPRMATQILRQVYAKYPASPEKPRILEAMARNYLKLPDRVEVAAGRLAQGAKLWGERKLQRPLVLPNGQQIADATFSEALTAVRKYSTQAVSRGLPDFHLPVVSLRDVDLEKEPPPAFLPQKPDSIIANVKSLVLPMREFARYDRIVTGEVDGTLSIYPVGNNAPLATSKALDGAARQCAWVGDHLLVWSAQQIAAVQTDNGAVSWKVTLKELPAAAVVGVDAQDDSSQANGPGAPPDAVMLQIRRQQLRAQMVIVQGRAVQPFNPAPPAPPPGEEQIQFLRPVGDRIILASSDGRVLALNANDGHVAWQTRLSGGGIERLLATDDFTVVRQVDDFTQHILALDSYSGRILYHRHFNAQQGLLSQNLALSADGILVYTLPDRLCGKDLYEPGDGLKFEEPRQSPGGAMPPYMGATQEDQLLISEGRILALSDGGQFVRVHSLETGRLLRHTDPNSKTEVDSLLGTTDSDPRGSGRNPKVPSAAMRIVGPYLYIIGGSNLSGYNLERPDLNWTSALDPDITPNVRDVFVGQHHLVLLDQPTAKTPGAAASFYRLHAYSLAKLLDRPGQESGVLDHLEDITDPAGITQWQAVNGGFYYLSGDNKLHYLRGSRQ